MSPEILHTLAPFVPTGFAMLMLLLSIRKMSEEIYVPKIAPLVVIGITTLAVSAYVMLTRSQINWTVAALLIAGGFLIGGVEGQMTRLYYRGPIIVGKRSVGYLIFWGLAYLLTMALTATGNGTLHAAGIMTLMFGLGIAVGDNTTLLLRQLFLKRPPAPAAPAITQADTPTPTLAATIRSNPSAKQFKNVEAEYFRLRGQQATGRITRVQLEAALKEMMIQDAQDRWWTMGVDSGKWYVRQGESWVESNPLAAQASTAPQVIIVPTPMQTPSSGCSNCGCLVMGTLVLVMLAAIVLIAGYVLILAVS